MRFTHTELHASGDALTLPHHHCYWLLPGRLLAGEHPGARGLAVQALRLAALHAAGIRCFIDLTTPADPLPVYTLQAGQRLSVPIADFGLPTAAAMRAALDAMSAALDTGQGVYLHCRAGIGRTGTVAGCWLIEQGLPTDEALTLLQRKFQAAAQSRSARACPETSAQRAFVGAWRTGSPVPP